MRSILCVTCFALVPMLLTSSGAAVEMRGIYFPPAGQSITNQDQRRPQEVGMRPDFIARIKERMKGNRWALWRHGYLVYVDGDFNKNTEVASLRKTWHALTVGAAIGQGKIPSVHQRIEVWCKELTGKDAEATWWHVITQTSAFDYPYGEHPAYEPGRIWTYSDKNPRHLCNALARVYGKKDWTDDYDDVVRRAYFDAIDLGGWTTRPRQDGIRFQLDLEDMGRLGLLVLARGKWRDKQVIPRSFVEQLETKQTGGAKVNYNGPDDGVIGLDPKEFPEAPYGFMTWVNTDGDYYPGADEAWAWGAGAGGSRVLWNRTNGIVFAGFGVPKGPSSNGIPHIIESGIVGPNPLVDKVLTFAKWAPIEIEFTGPKSKGRGDPNPFAISLDVIFTGPDGTQHRVPGFYDGDGRGGLDGNVWKVRFSADETGLWKYVSQSDNRQLDGHSGKFVVTEPPEDAPAFYRWGRLEYTGTAENGLRYLKFRDGPYWLKAGCDDPENFLGNCENYNTTSKRKAAVDYLATRGINSIYIMTHNIDGDDRDVWPWLGDTPREAKANGRADARFDIAKLVQWRELFEYMQNKGLVPYLVLEDDSAWKGYRHGRYYREMIARFGDLPALLFNFNEEHNENYKLSQALEFMRKLEEIDPYDHPRGIHNVNTPNDQYIDAPQVDFTSIQTGSPGTVVGLEKALGHHRTTLDWIERCRQRGRRILVVNFDEGRPEEDRHAWWSAYLAGGVWEAHVNQPYDRPMSAWEPVWTQLGGTRAFMESLPFWQMESHDELVKSGKAFCLAKPGEVYALYLPTGGTVTVSLPANKSFDIAWWNPSNGRDGHFQNQTQVKGGRRRFTPP
ncbi:MAG: DUF5060 domain-containing protein, partial [Phycisphaerales bacterium]